METSQHSGKKTQTRRHTHTHAWTNKWKVLVFPSVGELSNQATGLGAMIQVCILTDKPQLFSQHALTSWFTKSVIDPLRFCDSFFSPAFPTEIFPDAKAEV